jgi:DNA-binding XRE family transcriptional regulator
VRQSKFRNLPAQSRLAAEVGVSTATVAAIESSRMRAKGATGREMIAALGAASVRFVSTLESGRLNGVVRCGFAPAGQANGVVVQFRGRDNCTPKGDADQPPSAPAFQRDPQPASSDAMPAPTTE